jgi:hypothetical protein
MLDMLLSEGITGRRLLRCFVLPASGIVLNGRSQWLSLGDLVHGLGGKEDSTIVDMRGWETGQ